MRVQPAHSLGFSVVISAQSELLTLSTTVPSTYFLPLTAALIHELKESAVGGQDQAGIAVGKKVKMLGGL